MASINDLATAATIASSAVALQASPQQQQQQQPQTSPQAPLTPTQQHTAPAISPSNHISSWTNAAAGGTPGRGVLAPPHVSSSPANGAGGTASEAELQLSPSHILNTEPPPLLGAIASAAAAAAAAAAAVAAAAVAGPMDVDGDMNADGDDETTARLRAALAVEESRAQSRQQQQQQHPQSWLGGGGVSEQAEPGGTVKARDPVVRGAFIVFEGMDRAGKTTQAKLLQQRLIEEGREVRYMRFPDRTTPIGQMIDAYLSGQSEIEDHVIHLLFTANRWEAVKTIHAHLASGVTIICDRYYMSGIVYSAAKQNPSLSLRWAKAPELGLPRPDLVLFLDLEERVARARGGWGGEIYERGEMQRRVRELFWGLSMGDLSGASGKIVPRRDRFAAAGADGNGASAADADYGEALRPQGEKGEFRQEEEDLQIVDADLGVEELSEKVWEHVLPRLEVVERGEVGEKVRIVRY